MNMFFQTANRGTARSGPRFFLGRQFVYPGVLFAIIFIVWLLGQQPLLVLRSGNEIARTWPVKPGDRWQIQYTHSVERTPVEECFVVENGGALVLYATRYRSYGVGLPSLPGDGVFEQKDGYFELKTERTFRQIKFRNGLEARPEMLIGGRVEPLYQYYQPGELMVFAVEKRWQYYWKWIMGNWRGQS